MKKNKTPTALPDGTMLQLGELFGAAISLDTARRIRSIEQHFYWHSDGKKFSGWIDIEVAKDNGDIRTIRSMRTNITQRAGRDLQRKLTRKIAMFLFENQLRQAA